VAAEQFMRYSPETLESFQRLAETGCVEFIGETYYHSLSAIYDEVEFKEQVESHRTLMRDLFKATPRVFRNTELIYDDRVGRLVADMGYRGVIAEGADDILDWRSPNFVYQVPGTKTALLLKNYRLSDDIAFRFSNQGWADFPLTADKFAGWVHGISGAGEVVNLFMDYETFGEHQWASTGIFEFLEHLPEAVLRHPDWDFKTPSEVVDTYAPVADLSYHRTTSWADVDRDLTAWRGNRMQSKALSSIYDIGREVCALGDPELVDAWRKLLTSDHFYYMCTKWFADGDVHAYFSPYESPYDAFMNYENVLKDFMAVVRERELATVIAQTNALAAARQPAITVPSKRSGHVVLTN
jgi:alpha-amylase